MSAAPGSSSWTAWTTRSKRPARSWPRAGRPVALLGATLLTLAGCAGESGADGPPVSEGGTLTFANWQWLEPGRGDRIWDEVSRYSEENPQVRLEQREITRASYESSLATQIGAGRGPDIMIIPEVFYPDLAEAGVLEPLDGVLEPENEAQLIDANERLVHEGEQLAYVWEAVPYGFFWNKDLLAEAGVEPPTTPEELVAAAQQVTETTGVTGFAVRHQMNEEGVWWQDYANWTYGFGGDWSDGENLTLDRPENIEALTAYKAMYDSGAFAVGDDASTFRSRFAEGNLAMMIDNSSAVSTILGDTIGSEDIGASALPFPGQASAEVGVYIGINANSDNKELAKDLVRWLFTEDAQSGLAAALAPSALGTDVPTPESFIADNPWVPVFREQLEHSDVAVVDGLESQTTRIRKATLTQLELVLTKDLDPAEALRRAQAEAEDAIS